MKKQLFTVLVILLSCVMMNAQEFKKGDKVASVEGNLGFFDRGEKLKLGYGGKLAFEYGVADGLFGGKGAIGIGLVASDLYGGKYEGANTCTYNYTYVTTTYAKMSMSGSSRSYIDSKTQTKNREGKGAAKCDVNSNDATLMATVSLHYQLIDKLDTYFMVGGGATVRSHSFGNYHDAVNMEKVDHYRKSPTVGNYDGPVVSYYYDDFAHAKWEGAETKVYPAICASLGARYYFNDNWAATVEVGLNTLTIKKEINTYTLCSLGASYKF